MSQIEYRKRLAERNGGPVNVPRPTTSPSQPVAAAPSPPAAVAMPVVVETPTVAPAPAEPAPVATAFEPATRTPAMLREQGAMVADEMMSLPAGHYEQAMTALSETDPTLFSVVSDIIADLSTNSPAAESPAATDVTDSSLDAGGGPAATF